MLDTETAVWEYRRAPYDIVETQSRIRAAHLPERLAARLAYGW
jgi:hypothetical protein